MSEEMLASAFPQMTFMHVMCGVFHESGCMPTYVQVRSKGTSQAF